MMKRIALLLLLTSPAFGQGVQQSGTVTPGHPLRWLSNGVVGDAGTATSGFLAGLGITQGGAPGICVTSAASTAAGRRQLCLSTLTSANPTISVQNFGTATAAPLSFSINGVTMSLPTTTGTLGQCLVSSGSASPMTWGTCGSGGGGGVTSFNSRTGAVVPQSGDYSFSLISGSAVAAQLPTATSSALGIVEPDNVTITVSGGVISAVAGSGTVTGPGSSTVGFIPQWSNTAGTALGAGLPVGTTGTNTVVETTGSGFIAAGVFPALTGDITTAAGALATSYNNVVPASKGGAGTVTGALKGNGAGLVTQAAASDLSNGVSGSGAIALVTSPALLGVPTTPTAAPGTNTTQLASTAFVAAAVSAGGASTPVVQTFHSPGDYTPGSTTTLTLSSAPTSAAILHIFFDGIDQAHDTFSLGGALVTFNAAIPSNTLTVEAQWYAPAIAAGVNSLGGMTGSIACGTGLTCAASTISVTSGALPALTNANIWVGNASNAAVAVVPSGDITMSNAGVFTLASVNANVGAFGGASVVPSFTVNAKGLITAASSLPVIAPAGTLSGTALNTSVVTSSLTSVGIITAGTWRGSPITLTTRVVVASGGITVTAADYLVVVKKTVGAATAVSIPGSPAQAGTTFIIKDGKGDAATNNITVSPTSGNIDGLPNYVINAAFGSVSVTWDGATWGVN